MTDEVLQAEVTVGLRRPEAFQRFTDDFGSWWPPEFSWSGADLLAAIGMEPRADGALYEIGPHGLRWDWGRVLQWEPGERLVFSWQIGPDRVPVARAEDATEVCVRFAGTGGTTVVRVDHSGWERHGDRGPAYRKAFADVWPYALDRLAATG